MIHSTRKRKNFSELHKRAKERLKERVERIKNLTPLDPDALFRELEIYHIELELLNEELRTTQQELEESRSMYADLYNVAPIGYFALDESGVVRSVNITGIEMLGKDEGGIVNRPFSIFVEKDDLAAFEAHKRDVFSMRTKQRVELRLTRNDGSALHAQLQSICTEHKEGCAACCHTAVIDITERKQMEEIIRYQAYHDTLTDLPNRMLFINRLHLELTHARRYNTKLAVLFLDLDRFKIINDSLGHPVGDRILGEAARRLTACVRESDTVARFGGDAFAVLLPSIVHAEDAAMIAEKVIAAIQRPFAVGDHELYITASIGISMYPGDSEHAEMLLKHADIAMYHAKGQGRDNFQFYNAALNVKTLERTVLENSLRHTLQRGDLLVYYQPQIDLATRSVVCAEALVRWKHPEWGMLNPLKFIPLAEETGLIIPLDEWVLRTACAQTKAWQDAGHPSLCVAVNISARQFMQSHFADMVSGVLHETGLAPRFLELEITENTAMRDIERTIPQLYRLADRGINISLDDFGSGYTSLSRLKHLPVGRLKIDRSFIRGLIVGDDDRAIVNSVVAMAHNLRMKVVAEGVETDDQLSFLSSAGCDEVQGFLLSEPLPGDTFEWYIRTTSRYF